MSFGIAVTETLDDDVPDKRRPVVEQEYDLDDDVDGQPVGRQTGARGGTSTFLCQQPGGR